MSIRLGYQMPNFSYGGSVADLFPTVNAQAREAEDAGFDAAFVMDHVYQLPGLGSPDQPMLEAYSALPALATGTSRIQLSALVTGNTYRHPAVLAKTVTALDVVSGGRAVLGIGAGWFELEHRQFGIDFGTFTERFEKLDEALQIIEPMLRGGRPTVDGKWYRTEDAMNEPRLRDDLPIMLGGGGERKTFGLAARHAQHLNIICDPKDLPRKLAALDERCAEAGRDRSTLDTSFLAFVMMDEDGDRARELQRGYLRGIGVDLDALSDDQRQRHRPALRRRSRRGGRRPAAPRARSGRRRAGRQLCRQRPRARGGRPGRPHPAQSWWAETVAPRSASRADSANHARPASLRQRRGGASRPEGRP